MAYTVHDINLAVYPPQPWAQTPNTRVTDYTPLHIFHETSFMSNFAETSHFTSSSKFCSILLFVNIIHKFYHCNNSVSSLRLLTLGGTFENSFFFIVNHAFCHSNPTIRPNPGSYYRRIVNFLPSI